MLVSRRRSTGWGAVGPFFLALSQSYGSARANWRVYEQGGFALDAGFMAGVGFFASPNAQFGAGTWRVRLRV
jgi:hypothetical protein